MEEKKKRDIEKKELEKMLKLEEIKNNDNTKQNKEKEREKEYINSYINSLDKKKNDFTPMIYRHPEKVYLKAINDYEISKEKLKKNNHKNVNFDLLLNRTKINKFFINAEKKEENLNTNNNINNYNNKLKTSYINNNSNENNESKTNFKKKKLIIKIGRGYSTENSNLNNYKSPTKTVNNIYKLNTTNSHRKLIPKIIDKRNHSHTTKKINSDEKREITLSEMVQFLLENENEINTLRKPVISNPINYRKAAKQKNKILNSLNDPFNPYSVLFYNNMLYNNYNVGMHYKNIKQGVPNLRIKKMNRNDLPPLFFGNNPDEKMMSNTYSTSFHTSNKKKDITLPDAINQQIQRKKLYIEEETENIDIKNKNKKNEGHESKINENE